MSSINTNVAAMTALQSLTQTNKALTETQNRISTGFRVADASDNAAYWSIATTMRSDNAALSTVQDALGLGAATVDVAYTGINSAIDVVDQIKSKLVAARQPGVDRAKIQSEITRAAGAAAGASPTRPRSPARTGCRSTPSAAAYNATKSIVSSFSRTRRRGLDRHHQHRQSAGTKLFDADTTTCAGILDASQHDHQRRRRLLGRRLRPTPRHLRADRQRRRPCRPRADTSAVRRGDLSR